MGGTILIFLGPFLFQLVDVDVIAGLDMMIQRGQWDKAIETAEQQVLTGRHVILLYVVLFFVTISGVVLRHVTAFVGDFTVLCVLVLLCDVALCCGDSPL